MKRGADRRGEAGDRSRSRDEAGAGPAGTVERVHRHVGNQAVERLVEEGDLRRELAVGSSHGPAEREARRVAEAVVDGVGRGTAGAGGDAGGERASGDDSDGGVTVRRSVGGRSGGADRSELADRIDRKAGSGRPLPESLRSQFEAQFDRDFSEVRVHRDAEASALAGALNATAFTSGSDIFFRTGAYRPGTADGESLIAHELTHVVQQTGRGSTLAGRRGPVQRQGNGSSDTPRGFKHAKGKLMSASDFVSLAEKATKKHDTVTEVLQYMSTEIQRPNSTGRYLLCDIEGGVLDGKHFISAALDTYNGTVSKEEGFETVVPFGETIRSYSPHVPMGASKFRAEGMGYLLELKQFVGETVRGKGDSGFSSEDLPSNGAGADFGMRLATLPDRSEMFDPEDVPNHIPSSLKLYLQKLNPKPPTKAQFKTLKQKWNSKSVIW
jgi:hypothetical protein